MAQAIIGSDETLKGDTFGGIVVAAVRATREQRAYLVDLGVTDSKLVDDTKIVRLAPLIEKNTDNIIKNLFPDEYNQFEGNVTDMLNSLHEQCGDYLKPGIHVVDKFPGCTVGDVIETKAERKYIEVAAASILARAHGLQQLDQLSKRAGFRLPKGSTHVADALKELRKRKLSPDEFVKVHFKNVQQALK